MSKQEVIGGTSDMNNTTESVRIGLREYILDLALVFFLRLDCPSIHQFFSDLPVFWSLNVVCLFPLIFSLFLILFELVLGIYKSFNSKLFLKENILRRF